MGEESTERERDRRRDRAMMKRIVARRMDAGAIGFGTSVLGQPRRLCRPAGAEPRRPTVEEMRRAGVGHGRG